MLNERAKNIGIGSYCIPNNYASDHQDDRESAASPENETDVKRCGCYIVKEKDESDRAWVTYSTYYTYHHLCQNHMSEYREHNLSEEIIPVNVPQIDNLAAS